MPRKRRGDMLGPYTLLSELGRGGNATVWRAKGPHGEVALKVLTQRDHNSEPYRRFRREIEQLVNVGHLPGVLPLLESHLPKPGASEPEAWLAMPVAEPLAAALGGSPTVESVVRALSEIAAALATLHELGMSHRDVKPDNLYRYAGKFVVGDFGLVDAPDVEALTTGSSALGPLYFLAPEMLDDPATADGGMADVYSFGKTAWALLTGKRFPPAGEHRPEERSMRLTRLAAHPDAALLDNLVAAATRHAPEARPTMIRLASELEAWLVGAGPTPAVPSSVVQLSRLAERVSAIATPTAAREVARLAKQTAAWRVADEFAARAESVAQACRDAGLRVSDRPHHPERPFGSSFGLDADDTARQALGVSAVPQAWDSRDSFVRALGFVLLSEDALPTLKVFVAVQGSDAADEITLIAGTAVVSNGITTEVLDAPLRTVLLDGPAMHGAMDELVSALRAGLTASVAAWAQQVEQAASRN